MANETVSPEQLFSKSNCLIEQNEKGWELIVAFYKGCEGAEENLYNWFENLSAEDMGRVIKHQEYQVDRISRLLEDQDNGVKLNPADETFLKHMGDLFQLQKDK